MGGRIHTTTDRQDALSHFHLQPEFRPHYHSISLLNISRCPLSYFTLAVRFQKDGFDSTR